jgi:hypothetical protein
VPNLRHPSIYSRRAATSRIYIVSIQFIVSDLVCNISFEVTIDYYRAKPYSKRTNMVCDLIHTRSPQLVIKCILLVAEEM